MKKIFYCLMAAITLFSSSITFAQGNGNSALISVIKSSSSHNGKLGKKTLNQATTIKYHFDVGSLPPECKYAYSIIVERNMVRVVVTTGYDGNTVYDQTEPISDASFKRLISTLASQDIRIVNNYEPLCGGSVESLYVVGNDRVLFKGSDDIEVGKGYLSDAFLAILPPSMRKTIDNVTSFVK